MWHSGIFAILLAAGLAAPGPVAEAAEDDAGAWLIFAASGPFPDPAGSSPWRYAIDIQARYFDIGSGANQFLLRPNVVYALGKQWSARAGYARLRTRARSGATVTEDRLWEQLSWRGAISEVASLGLRLRAEQRFLSAGDDTGHVLRLRASYSRPLNRDGDTDIVVSVEPFFNLRDTDFGAESGLSQNRIYLGLRFALTDRVSLSAGYLNQRFFRNDAEDLENHLAQFGLQTRF